MRAPMRPRRILFVEASMGGVVGGSLTGVLHLIARMDRRRFAPALALFEAKPGLDHLPAAGVPVHVLPPLPVPRRVRGRARAARAVARAHELITVTLPRARAQAALFRREQPDLVYLANGLTACLDGVVAATLGRLPVICHEKGFRRVGPAERLMSRWVSACICMTDEIAAHYAARRVRAQRLVTIYDGIDRDLFAPGGGTGVRRELGIAPDAPVIGIVGHIQEWKGQHLVVEAMARVRERAPEARCLIVGGVHRRGVAYAERLRERIAALGLERQMILTGARHDVPACLEAMDVAVHASLSPEPFGRVLIEAMALGRPVIAPREGGPRWIVVDGETGLLVPPRDATALADAIVTLLADPTRRDAMGRAARERVDAVFDIRHHVRAVEALLDDILRPDGSSR